MRTFFGGTFINEEQLEESGKKYPIKLEYYKQINEDEMFEITKAKYGIHIVATEYIPDNIKIETKSINYITNDEILEDKILNIFKENQVTIINSEEVLKDLMHKNLQNYLN